jgi:hypothetical protein
VSRERKAPGPRSIPTFAHDTVPSTKKLIELKPIVNHSQREVLLAMQSSPERRIHRLCPKLYSKFHTTFARDGDLLIDGPLPLQISQLHAASWQLLGIPTVFVSRVSVLLINFIDLFILVQVQLCHSYQLSRRPSAGQLLVVVGYCLPLSTPFHAVSTQYSADARSFQE